MAIISFTPKIHRQNYFHEKRDIVDHTRGGLNFKNFLIKFSMISIPFPILCNYYENLIGCSKIRIVNM
jgi:hypothetical protein